MVCALVRGALEDKTTVALRHVTFEADHTTAMERDLLDFIETQLKELVALIELY